MRTMLSPVGEPACSVAASALCGQHVHPAAEDQGRRVRPRVASAAGARAGRAPGGAALRRRRGAGPGELVQVRDGVVVELQRPGERVEHLLRRMALAALLEPDVVVGADAGERGELLTPQPRDAAAAQVRQADILGPDPLPARPQELAEAVVASIRLKVAAAQRRKVAVSLPGSALPGYEGSGQRPTGAGAHANHRRAPTPKHAPDPDRPRRGRHRSDQRHRRGHRAAPRRRRRAVALLGRREERLKRLASELRDHTGAAATAAADVTDPARSPRPRTRSATRSAGSTSSWPTPG